MGDNSTQREVPPGTAPPSSDGLGLIIFERRPRPFLAVVCYFGAVFFVIVLIPSLALFASDPRTAFMIPICLLVYGTLIVIGILGGIHNQRSCFRCHESGVYQKGLLGDRTLRYDEMNSFTYSATRIYMNGNYTGTKLVMKFIPEPGIDKPRISYATNVKNADEDLERLRDQIARMIAGRLASRLAAGETVDWTPHLRFVTGQGIENEPMGFMGRKATVLVPYSDIASYKVEQGIFYVWQSGTKNPVIKEAVSEPNFFPGFYLFLSMANPGPE